MSWAKISRIILIWEFKTSQKQFAIVINANQDYKEMSSSDLMASVHSLNLMSCQFLKLLLSIYF